jgi:hypothetical protein
MTSEVSVTIVGGRLGSSDEANSANRKRRDLWTHSVERRHHAAPERGISQTRVSQRGKAGCARWRSEPRPERTGHVALFGRAGKATRWSRIRSPRGGGGAGQVDCL